MPHAENRPARQVAAAGGTGARLLSRPRINIEVGVNLAQRQTQVN